MQYLRGLYEKLSEDKKDELFAVLHDAIKWRGGGVFTEVTMIWRISRIAELIHTGTGTDLEEFT